MFLLKCFLVNACKGGISPGGVVRKKRMQRFGLTTDRTAPNPTCPPLQMVMGATGHVIYPYRPTNCLRDPFAGAAFMAVRSVVRPNLCLFWSAQILFCPIVCGRPLTLPVRPCQWFTSKIR